MNAHALPRRLPMAAPRPEPVEARPAARALPSPDALAPEILARWPVSPPKPRAPMFAATRAAVRVLAGWLILASVILLAGAGGLVVAHTALKAALEVAAVVEGQR